MTTVTVTVTALRTLWDQPNWDTRHGRGNHCLTHDEDGDLDVIPISTSDLRPDLSIVITDTDLWEHMDGEWDDGAATQLAADLTRDLAESDDHV